MDSLGLSCALIRSTTQPADTGIEFAQAVDGKAAGPVSGAAMQMPTSISQEAAALVLSLGADCLISIDGGSATDPVNASTLHTDLPQIIIPKAHTRFEATSFAGQTENGRKTTITTPSRPWRSLARAGRFASPPTSTDRRAVNADFRTLATSCRSRRKAPPSQQ